jgi:CheY-like chemotaxis protein
LAHAEQARSRFLHDLGRSLRSPLASVLGLAERLAREPLPAEGSRQLAELRCQADALLANLLGSLDRHGLGDAAGKPERLGFDLHALLQAVVEQQTPLAAARGIELACHRSLSLPRWVIGDPGRLRLVACCLVDEALRRTDEGAVTLHASDEERCWDDTVRVRLVVQDTGADAADDDLAPECAGPPLHGPRSAHAPRLADDRRASGWHELVERLGGASGFEGQPGCGTVTWCTVPLAIDVASEALGLSILGHCHHRPTALLVVGDRVQRELLLDLLEERGWSHARAETLARIVDCAENLRIDLALLDLDQPDELLEQQVTALRARGSGAPAIFGLCSGDEPRDRRLVRHLRLGGRLPRPLRPEVLDAVLRRHHPEWVDRPECVDRSKQVDRPADETSVGTSG